MIEKDEPLSGNSSVDSFIESASRRVDSEMFFVLAKHFDIMVREPSDRINVPNLTSHGKRIVDVRGCVKGEKRMAAYMQVPRNIIILTLL